MTEYLNDWLALLKLPLRALLNVLLGSTIAGTMGLLLPTTAADVAVEGSTSAEATAGFMASVPAVALLTSTPPPHLHREARQHM